MSVIVAGCSPWTVYSGFDYTGDAGCFFPADEVDCAPGIYTSLEGDAAMLRDGFNSMRKGCLAAKKIRPGFISPGLKAL